ncbi:MAG: RelA/SpoT family protein [Halothiobacillaceae bacterium]|nr:RelA/SpoT family protein [Halothiobacillaceae bacterium]
MQHPLDQHPAALCADLLAQTGENPLLHAACEQASAVWDGDPTRPRGARAALLLCEMKADPDTLLAATLGDPRLRASFDEGQMAKTYGHRIARMVAELHRLNTFEETQAALGNPQQAENIRRLLLSMVSDVRVILIKLAYRLERLRALPLLDNATQRQSVARETLDIFAPLAHRLGLGQLKWELEDLAFRHLEPETYKRIASLLDEKRTEREDYMRKVREQLDRALSFEGIRAKVYGRPKHLYSIFEKMRRKKLSFEQLFDVRALRVQVDNINDCYAVLSVVHTLWQAIHSEYDDYIAHPKPNGYQSLHTAVHALEGKTLEVQIRTAAMHDQAELGVAAHWRYKEGGHSTHQGRGDRFEDDLERLRLALEEGDGGALQTRSIYVFTPKGHVIELPQGATPLDLAYSLHTELGHQCKGAKVNARLVPLNTPLKNTDRVELLRAPQGTPNREWADAKSGYLVSKGARAKVRAWFKQRERESAREEGHAHWDKTVRRLGLSREQRERLLHTLKFKSETAVWEALGEGQLSHAAFLDAARAILAQAIPASDEHTLPRRIAAAAIPRSLSLEGLQAEPARCCNPMPGDAIVGFITRGQGLRLHRTDCHNLVNLRRTQAERLIEVEWPYLQGVAVRAELLILGEDRAELLSDISHVLSMYKARVNAIDSSRDKRTEQVRMRLKLELPKLDNLQPLIDKLVTLNGLDEVRRV